MREKLLSKLMLLLAFVLVGAGNAWADSWVKTAASDLQTGDVVAIVDETGGCAMSNDKGTSAAPAATTVTISDGKIASVGDNLKWKVTVSDKGYQFNVPDTEKYLYCINSNNGVRVGSGANNLFTLSEAAGENDVPFLVNSGTSRYVGVYNNQDWRCYTSVNSNISNCVTAFYKLTSGGETPTPVVETVKTPTFNPAAGEVDEGTVVTIASETEGATIYYTTDGSVPTTESATYEEAIEVTEAMTIKAIAVKEGMTNSAVATAEYTIKEESGSGDEGDTKTDVLNREFTGITGTTYTEWSGKTSNSDAVYAGQSAGSNESIQLRSNNNNSGVVTTNSGGKVKKIIVTWNSNTANGRTLNVYGSNTAYTAATDLYDEEKQGTLLGTIVNGTSTELVVTGDYEYVGLRSASGAMYLDKVEIVWAIPEGGETSTAVATTVTIDATGITNTNLFEGENAGKLTAVVKTVSGEVIEGAVVSWESGDENVAEVADDGTVTLVEAGTAVITATYAGVKDQYKPSEATYTLTVTNDDPNGPGTADNPYTVAQARAAIDAGAGVTGVYAKGIVSEIVTEFNPQYGNITYNISEDGTTTGDQLQAYRGKGKDGAYFTSEDDIKVGDIVVVYGNLKKYNTTYEFDANNQLVSLERVNTSISADNVDIAFDATTGAIAYTIDNPTDQGVMSATTTSDWLTLANDFSSPIAFTCGTNSDGVSRTAIVTLTYTFGNEKVTKEVTVTQAGNPDVVNNISDITEVDVAYSVRGTVVATNARGFVIGDGTGYVYYYKNSAPAQAVGDKVSISGTTGTYGKIIQFTSAATVAEAASSNYNNTPAATVITEVPDYTKEYHLSTYLQFEGKLTKNGSNYLIALGEEQIQISYPTEAQQAELGELEGKTVQVKGYFSGINSSAKFTVMLEGVEEVITNDPFINAEDVELEYDATTGEIAFTIDNPVTGTVLTASATADWITRVAVNGDKVIFATTANVGDADRTATITLVYGEVTKDVTVTQKHYVVDYATLPFVWEGGAKDVFLTVNGVTANGLGSDYAESHAPYRMKFDTTGDYIQVKTNAQPGRVTIGVKMIGGANESKITVQASADGEEFTDVQELTISGSQNSVLTLATTKFFAEDCRYVRLVFTKGSNVGIGAISIDEPISYVEATVGEAGYATFCSSWALELPENVTAYIVSAVSESDVTLTEVTAIPANTPVILKAEANSYELPIIEDADAVEGNMLLASDGTVQGDGASIFALGNKGEVGFYLVANGVTVPAGKAYLVVTAAVRDFLAFTNGEADGINAVDNGQFAVGNVVYDLSGRRVEKAVKGIYIVNGKKVVK